MTKTRPGIEAQKVLTGGSTICDAKRCPARDLESNRTRQMLAEVDKAP